MTEITRKAGHVTTSDGVRLHYLEAGAGQPLVLIPGWSQTAAMYQHQLDGLGQYSRVIALDMRGPWGVRQAHPWLPYCSAGH
jgi:pimeloyl-ACP methyl ester carboxylesterase